MLSITNRMYYHLKPIIPRRLQILMRRKIVHQQLQRCGSIWPIDEKAGAAPEGWSGWPDGKQFALVLTHDVDTERGHARCTDLMEIEENLGFRSSFNFVPERYNVSSELRHALEKKDFEVGVHGLCHDGKYYNSKKIFQERALRINRYLKEWGAAGYRAPSMLHKLDWFHELNIEYDASTFDTDPFEPNSVGMRTIFPFFVQGVPSQKGYVELPYTLPQDFTLFVIMQNKNVDTWKKKLDWIAERGGMALLTTHPDYISFNGASPGPEEYPASYYEDFLEYVNSRYGGRYWHVLPRDLARFWLHDVVMKQGKQGTDQHD